MRLLLIRLREIGDVVFTTPALRGLRQHYPDAHISYVVEPAAAPIVANNPHIDEVIIAPRRRRLARVADDVGMIRRLRAAGYDMAIDFHSGPRSAVITWLSGAPVRVGYDIAGRGWMYTIRVPRPRGIRPRHAVLNQWDLLSALGLPAPDPATFPVEMTADPQAIASVAERLRRAGVGPGHAVIVVHVSAGNPFRRWPRAAFATLLTLLALRDPRRRIIVTSGPSDHQAAGEVIELAQSLLEPQEAERILACGEFSLAELRALLARSSLYVGGDSGPLHIAATTTIPIVGLYGPTLPVRSAPWRPDTCVTESVEVEGLPCRPCDQRTCEPGDFRCLGWLRPEQVIAAVEHALTRANPQSRLQA
jgi:lipopolysaccharide heptosyltransferase II